MDIQLDFINRSNDANNSEVVIFQKNVADGPEDTAIAWMVIQNCGIGDNHPFAYPHQMQVSCSDPWGNYTPQLDAQAGQRFALKKTASGNDITLDGSSDNPKKLHVYNGLSQGAMSANIFRSGKLLAQTTSITPAHKAAFQFEPTIWIGVASQIVEGQLMNSAILSNIDTELSLLGVASADIMMTGSSSTGFQFQLQNIVYV